VHFTGQRPERNYYLNQKTQPSPAPISRTVERKIGRTTFVVTSRFNDEKEKDIVATIARLIQYENPRKSA